MPKHDFVLIENLNRNYDYSLDFYLDVTDRICNNSKNGKFNYDILASSSIDDDIFDLFSTFFSWVQVKNSEGIETNLINNRWGVSLIENNNIKFYVLVESIRNLILLSTDKVINISSCNINSTTNFIFDKSETINKLNKILEMYDLMKQHSNLILIHFGV